MADERYVEKSRTWKDNWLNVVRYVIFQDEELKRLMCVPADTPITTFVDKYFIEDMNGDEIMTNEPVRITYYDFYGPETNNKNVRKCYKEFDIYVKYDVLHTATMDRLQNRYDLIAERLRYLLLSKSRVQHLHFEYRDEYGMWTKTIGYRRYHVVFSYMKTV